MTRRRRKSSKTKAKPSRASPIKLDPKVWARSGKSITDYRSAMLFEQEGKCAVSFLPIIPTGGTLDHAHCPSCCPNNVDGKVRGVLLSEINLFEGSVRKLFRKSKLNERYGLTLPELLINLGSYLQQDNSDRPYHHNYMSDLRKHINRLRKDQIESKLLKDFNISITGDEDKRELVRMYVQAFVCILEKKEMDML